MVETGQLPDEEAHDRRTGHEEAREERRPCWGRRRAPASRQRGPEGHRPPPRRRPPHPGAMPVPRAGVLEGFQGLHIRIIKLGRQRMNGPRREGSAREKGLALGALMGWRTRELFFIEPQPINPHSAVPSAEGQNSYELGVSDLPDWEFWNGAAHQPRARSLGSYPS